MSFTSYVEKIYPYLPIALQNTLISVQGWRFKKQRFGSQFSNQLKQLIENSRLSEKQLKELQLKRLKSFLLHAETTSPYWKKAFETAGIEAGSLQKIDDLRSFPILEKEDLRKHTKLIASKKFADDKLVWIHTSGTTGTPITVAYTQNDMKERFATLHRMLNQFDIAPHQRSIRFSGRTLFPNAQKNRKFWRYNAPMRQLLMSSYDMLPTNLAEYAKKMQSFKPALIDGYPSSIYTVAKYLNSCEEPYDIRPKVVMTTAETLEPFQRAEIQKAFGKCRIVNQYASSEGAPFITEDVYGDLLVNTDTGVFEFVKPGTDQPAKPGEIAEMLVTSFTTNAFPLIRYRIGDTVVLPKVNRLANSWEMPVVDQILGRQEDVIFTPEKGYVGRLDPVFKKSPSTIIESQIIQTSPMGFILKVVPDETAGYERSQLDSVQKEMKARLGDIKIIVEETNEIQRGANGKFSAVIGMKKDQG